MLKSIFVSPDGKPYIITMKIYLISVSVSDVSLEQAGSELSGRDFISGLAVVQQPQMKPFNVPATSGVSGCLNLFSVPV